MCSLRRLPLPTHTLILITYLFDFYSLWIKKYKSFRTCFRCGIFISLFTKREGKKEEKMGRRKNGKKEGKKEIR